VGSRARTDVLRSRLGWPRTTKVSLHSSRDSLSVSCGGLIAARYAPGPSLRAMELLLGRISSLGDVGDFTTQSALSTDVDSKNLKA
jgi:hypothetical protein